MGLARSPPRGRALAASVCCQFVSPPAPPRLSDAGPTDRPRATFCVLRSKGVFGGGGARYRIELNKPGSAFFGVECLDSGGGAGWGGVGG